MAGGTTTFSNKAISTPVDTDFLVGVKSNGGVVRFRTSQFKDTYNLPIMSSDTLGGAKAGAKTSADTIPVHVDANGMLWVGVAKANKDIAGTVKADAKNLTDTVPVHIDDSGYLWVGIDNASAENLGCIRANERQVSDTIPVHIDDNGFLWVEPSGGSGTGGGGVASIPIATAERIGGVMVGPKTANDTMQVHIDAFGRLWYQPNMNVYELPVTASNVLGGIKANFKTQMDIIPVHADNDGFLWVQPTDTGYVLPMANNLQIGGVKADNTTADDTVPVHIDSEGYLWTSNTGSSGGTGSYILPITSNLRLGGVKAPAKTEAATVQVMADEYGYMWIDPSEVITYGDQVAQGIKDILEGAISNNQILVSDGNGSYTWNDPVNVFNAGDIKIGSTYNIDDTSVYSADASISEAIEALGNRLYQDINNISISDIPEEAISSVVDSYMDTKSGIDVKIGADLIINQETGDNVYTRSDTIADALQSVYYSLKNASNTAAYAEYFENISNSINLNTGIIYPAGASNLGAVKGAAKTTDDTIPVHIDETGNMWVKPTEIEFPEIPEPTGLADGEGNYYAYNHNILPTNSDNTTALQTLIDTVWNAGGGTIHIGNGVYKTKPLNMRSKVSLKGCGAGSTVLHCISTTGSSLKGVLHFPAYSCLSRIDDLAICGNRLSINGIYFAPTGYTGSFGSTIGGLYDSMVSNGSAINKLAESVRTAQKNIYVENVIITKCGPGNTNILNWDAGGWYAGLCCSDPDKSALPEDDKYYGNYNIDFKHLWLYDNDNGAVIESTDISFGDSYIDASLYCGMSILGGNNKFYNIKLIWSGMADAVRQQDNSDVPALALDDWSGRNSFVNFELQDNQSTDIKIQGSQNMFTNLLVDGANAWTKTKNYKVQILGSGHKVDGTLANYANKAAAVGITGECTACDIRFTAVSSCAETLSTLVNNGGETKVFSY